MTGVPKWGAEGQAASPGKFQGGIAPPRILYLLGEGGE